jgi:ABC-type multidrug transport system fused ATPase/permease subunit
VRNNGVQWVNSNFRTALMLLDEVSRRKLAIVVGFQITLGFLDLLGVAAIGILGALSITGLQSSKPGNRVNQALELLNIQNLSFQTQVIILALLAVTLLLSRTIISIFSTRKILFFLSHKAAKASADLTRKLLTQPLLDVQKKSSQETLYAVTNGVSTLLLGVVGTFVNMVSDAALLVILMVGLVVIDPGMTLGMLAFFSLVSFVLYKILREKVRALGRKNVKLTIASSEKLLEVLSTYREAIVRNRRMHYADFISGIRYKLGDVNAENSFVPYISKYVLELTVLISALIISATQFFINDAARAVGTLTVFLAAGTRIAPAALRIQQGLLGIKSNLSSAQPTLDLISNYKNNQPEKDFSTASTNEEFLPKVSVTDLDFAYPDSNEVLLNKVSFESDPGSVTALVGPTGAGKTTLIDLVLGIHTSKNKSITISGVDPRDAVSMWPGKIAYAPQDTVVIQGSIKQNVALGFNVEEIDNESVKQAIAIAQLEKFVSSLPEGLDTQVGERGARLSGGQKQRLGIARALYTSPKLLILDEATSSLDGETELAISTALHNLGDDVTVIVIAHRLATVRNASQVIYLEEGRILAKGSFEEVRRQIPNFDKQAKLMGL